MWERGWPVAVGRAPRTMCVNVSCKMRRDRNGEKRGQPSSANVQNDVLVGRRGFGIDPGSLVQTEVSFFDPCYFSCPPWPHRRGGRSGRNGSVRESRGRDVLTDRAGGRIEDESSILPERD